MQLLSICIPTFNRQKKLKLMLDSINSNTDVEIIICDDGSTDETQKIVDSFTDRLKIKYIYQKNLGVSAAILNAYNQASGKYLIKMDSDDCFSDTGLNFILDTIKNNEEKEAFLYGVYTNKNNKIAKNLPPNAITNFISVRADYKIQGDLKEVVRRNIVQKYMYKVPKEIKRIPPGLLWYRIAEKYNCLSFSKAVAIKNYSEDGITSKMHHLKISYPEAMVELYDLLSNSNVYKSNIYRWKARLLWCRYSFHNRSMNLKKWWHWFVYVPGWTIYFFDKIILSIKDFKK